MSTVFRHKERGQKRLPDVRGKKTHWSEGKAVRSKKKPTT